MTERARSDKRTRQDLEGAGHIDPSLSVEIFLKRALDDPSVALTQFQRFGTGHSGDTYRAVLHRSTRPDDDIVVRLSPTGVRIAGPADVGRQGRIMGTLHQNDLPAPAVLASDSTGAVDGRSIAVMSLVSGAEWHEFAERHSHDETANAAVSALKAIQTLSVEESGIAGDPRMPPEGEIARWVPLVERGPDHVQDAADELRVQLLRELNRSDPSAEPVLVHGDYHFGNLLFGPRTVNAVFDWEIAGLGHPLTDLACLTVAALRRRYEPEPNPTGSVEVTGARLAELYGADPDVLSWHVAASCFKYAAILAYNLQLSRRGRLRDPIYEELQGTMAGLLEDGRAVLDHGLTAFWPDAHAPQA
ncbi:hypothetical protein AXA44_07565 [Rhodococcus sp. SC4]|uniref:phosphotransferase family protein n=1 Tax=Rhodococcus sp. ACPA1 TaxID=2028572 RepID=UPI00076A58E7|nr:phosphotransferase family protein [Rhodococcus sp. ACPA1]KXF53872.1 hypothetical protein AXA44_07565 [Rhodococcus sp. SC4]PBC57950.1 phosphotransferase family protein [Rhodococcus sp. ACPA1]